MHLHLTKVKQEKGVEQSGWSLSALAPGSQEQSYSTHPFHSKQQQQQLPFNTAQNEPDFQVASSTGIAFNYYLNVPGSVTFLKEESYTIEILLTQLRKEDSKLISAKYHNHLELQGSLNEPTNDNKANFITSPWERKIFYTLLLLTTRIFRNYFPLRDKHNEKGRF